MEQSKLRLVKIIFFGLIPPLVALFYLCLDVYWIARVPDKAEWADASIKVRKDYQDGDIVVFVPPWALEGLPFFDGLKVWTSETVDWYEISKFSRSWVIFSFGKTPSSIPPDFQEIRFEKGTISIGLYKPSLPYQLVYDFLKNIQDAKVLRHYKDKIEECALFIKERWYCGKVHPWQFVGKETKDFGDAVRDVIWAHPLDKELFLEIVYPSVPMGKKMVFRYGLALKSFEDENPGGPVKIELKISEDTVFERTIGKEERGWFSENISLERRDGYAPVTLQVSTTNNSFRQFCFTADIWR